MSGECTVFELATIFSNRELFRVGLLVGEVVIYFLLLVCFFDLGWGGRGYKCRRCNPRTIWYSHRFRFAVSGLGVSSLEF